MGSLDGRAAILTNADRGIALRLATEGTLPVVNDLGVASDASGRT